MTDMDLRDQNFLSDLAFRRSRLRVYETAVAHRMSKATEIGWLRWERSIMDLFKTPEEIEADIKAGWKQLRAVGKSKGWVTDV